MPRRRKPAGLEKWTWAEINAGRKMSKAEKRWNRIGRDLNWDRRPDGSHQAPPQAVPILVIMLGLMLALAVVAPKGVANTGGDAGAIGALLMLGLCGMGVLLILVGHNFPASGQNSGPSTTVKPPPAPQPLPSQLQMPPHPPVIMPALKRLWEMTSYFLTFRWVSLLPEWAQPILWGLGMALPVVVVILLVMRFHR